MFFNHKIQRRLAILLQPWLKDDDSELELKLGFFRSNGTLNNITFNTSALNQLLDDPSKFSFKEVTVQHLSLQFSPFSSTAFTLIVRGLRIVLSLGEEKDEEGVEWSRKPKNTTLDERSKVLQEIDPEGCALHGVIKKLSDITTVTWRTSLLNTIIRHCQLQFHDTHVLLQSPSPHDHMSCSLYTKTIEAGSQVIGHRCFTRGLMSSIFCTSEESSFEVDVNGFEIRLNNKNSMSCLLPPTNMSVSVNTNHLQFTSICLRVPALKIIFSPSDLSVMLILYGLLSKEPRRYRTGRQLWNIVARNINSLLPTSNLSLIKVVRILCLWLRYINTYRSMLLLIGYPKDDILKKSATLMFRGGRYSKSVKSQWKLIAKMENDLPLEAVMSARRIIRSRVASNNPGKDENFDELAGSSGFSKFHQLLVLFLNMVGSFFYAVVRVMYLHKLFEALFEDSQSLGTDHKDTILQQNVNLIVQEFSISVSPDNAARPSISRKRGSDTVVLHQHLLSFHLSVQGFFLRQTENISEKCLTFASGPLKVFSSSLVKAGSSSHFTEYKKKEVNERKNIVWGEPAQNNYFFEATQSNATDNTCGISIPHLHSLLGELWLNWKDSGLKFEGEDTPNMLSPWFLCDIRSLLTDHDLDSRLRSCSFVIGKLNFNLEYFAIASIAVLLRQIQNTLSWIQKRSKSVLLLTPSITVQDPPARDLRSEFRSFSKKIEMDLIRRIPEQHVQIGAFISGPHIQISLSNFHTETSDSQHVQQVSCDICDIELLVSPYMEENLVVTSESTVETEREPQYHGLEEPQEIDISEPHSESYSCQGKISLEAHIKFNGLNVYFDDCAENQKYQIVVVSPITTQLRYIRKDHHSLGSSIVSFSATSHMVASGFSSLLFLDELYFLTKIIFRTFHEVLPSVKDGSNGGLNYEEESSGERVYSENGQTVLNRNISLTNTQCIVNTTCEIRAFDIVLHNSREMFNHENYMNKMSIDKEASGKFPMQDSSGNGIYISFQQLIVKLIFRGGNIDVVIDTAGVRSTIFRFLTDFEKKFAKSELKNLLRSLNFLVEASISHANFCLCLRTFEKALPSASGHYTADASSIHGKTLHMIGESSSVINTERLGDHCLITNIVCSGIYMGGCHFKDVLINDKRFEELNISFSAGREFQEISCQSKGGFVLLEATAAVMLIECFTSYCHWIIKLWPTGQSIRKVEVAQNRRELALDGHSNLNIQNVQCQELPWNHLELLSMGLFHFSIVLLESDESGRVQELLFEVDFHSNLEMLNIVRKISMNSKFSICSQFMHGARTHKAMVIQNPSFSSVVHAASSSSFVSNPPLKRKDEIPGRKNFYVSPLNYILKDMRCCLEAEEPVTRDQVNPASSNSIWVGNGSISGLDMTLSLSEIQMMLSAFGSVSEVLSREETYKEESRNRSFNQELEGSTHEMVADGTIVALQDADQHMYIAVEGRESRYDIAGTIHYSLVGERALFRVKYHIPRWKSQVQYFSLISLYAKDEYGESLRLNCHPRSRFVDISCSNDGGPALWSMLPYKPDAYEDATELESSCSPSKRMFHLVNKNNDCALAFIDGTLEFVSKPGNLFKWKVFDHPGPATNNLFGVSNSVEGTSNSVEGTSICTTGSNELIALPMTGNIPQSVSNVSDFAELRKTGNPLGITITVDKVTLTIVHELSDTEEKFPLLQGTIIPNQVIVHITNSKVRFMNALEVTICYFDALQNSWSEFIQPLDISTFYSFRFPIESPENLLNSGHSHLFANIKEVTILVSELSLDTLLFVIGKLDLAGPFAVKRSMVLANCCKVENQSGLNLHCQFYNQDASVSARESTTILLRHLALENRPPEASFFSVQLVQEGFLSTLPIHLSLKEARLFAWRTRIVSSHDSKSFPGPFIVIETVRTNEDGLSISVSPLLRIYNETDFSLELRFQRPHHKEEEYAVLTLKAGDVIDDSMAAFSAVDLSGGSRKSLTSLSVGNFVFSFRPNITDDSKNSMISSVEWSDDLKGGKPIRLSGIFDKLSYQVRKALSVDSGKVSLSSVNCALKSGDGIATHIYFLIQIIGKGIPVTNPDKSEYTSGNRNSPVAMQEQKQVFVLPTVQVSNLLHADIQVNLTEADPGNTIDHGNPWSCATIPCGSTVNFYANPATIFFVVTLTSFRSSCKPVNSSDWMRKLQKQKGNIHHFDIDLEFGGGKYLAMLRLSRGHRGTLKAVIFTPYALQNNTNTTLFCFAANQKPLPRSDVERSSSDITPDMGSYLPPNSVTSWFMKCHKLHFKLLEEKSLGAELDLGALSGLTEIDLEAEGNFGSKIITRLGVSLRPSTTEVVSSQLVSLSPRYVVFNESEAAISIRQCYIEDMEELIAIKSKQRIALRLKTVIGNRKETNVIENLLRKHTKSQDELSLFIQFKPNETELGWSGPICVASLGLFFLKFRKSLEFPQGQSYDTSDENHIGAFAAVRVVEEGPTIVLHFFRPPLTNLPYRVENSLRNAPVTYYQKGSSEPETLGAGANVNYVWDDLTLPHKLVIQLDDVHILREISLDKVRAWKPLYRNKQSRGPEFRLPLDKRPEDQKRSSYSQLVGTNTVKVGYEVYAEGVTRVLRICEFSDSQKTNTIRASSSKMRLRISYLALHLLEHTKQELDSSETSEYASIIITRVERFNWDSVFIDEHKYNQIRVRSLSVDEKWVGAPFAAMLRRHHSEKSDINDYILHVAVVLLPTRSGVKQVKYLSIVLQPLDLNLDEETLMKIVSFWRSSLSESSSPRQQYYFDHFEIHPLKIVASFLPGESNYSYSSTQETLRSLLHSVIQVPAIKSKTVELNGVLVTHALITIRDLTIKCAQHYSWYGMRAIYIARGSPLLPPAFASLFDDLASSSLDVFFDPSTGLVNLPGVTLGTLKLISKFIDNKGFSGTKRYFGDLGKTLKTAGSNIVFAAVTEVSDSVLKGAETSGVNGMINGFHQGVLKLAMEPSVLGSAFMEGGPDRKIKLDRSPGVDELYIEGYLQAMLDTMYKQEYLRVRVIENQVILKNLPPSSSLIEEIMERVKDFLASKSLLKGGSLTSSNSLRHIRGEREWRIGPTLLTLCEHLFVSFAIQILRKQAGKAIANGRMKWKGKEDEDKDKDKDKDKEAVIVSDKGQKLNVVWRWGIGRFLFSGIVAYVDGRLCRNIPHPIARRIVSGFLLSFLDNKNDDETK